jgi:hypothetical protein
MAILRKMVGRWMVVVEVGCNLEAFSLGAEARRRGEAWRREL